MTSIYYKEPEAFVKTLRESKNQKWEEQEEEQQKGRGKIEGVSFFSAFFKMMLYEKSEKGKRTSRMM